MANQQVIALLGDLLTFLDNGRNFSFGFERRRQRRVLAVRIEMELALRSATFHPAIREARERWATTSFLRIDRDESEIENNPDGTCWVRAWVKVSTEFPTSPDTSERRRYEAAVADMPERMRQIFLAHQIEDMSYPAIAQKFGTDVIDIQNMIGAALSLISSIIEEK